MQVDNVTLRIEVEIIALILVALVVYIVAKRVRMPYTIALVITGIMLSLAGPTFLEEVFPIGLSTDLILLVFLPGLVFEAAYHLNLRSLMDNRWIILGLAVPGLLISTALVGGIVHLVLGMPLTVALLFGALISATDPISVLALFKELRVPKRLSILMEGESLFNDGTAVVVFSILLGIVMGGDFTIAQGISQFAIVTIGGALAGFTIGLVTNYILDYVADDNAIQIAATIIVAYGTFLLAEELLHVSPVIAVVVAGITLGSNQRKETPISAQISITDFWDLVAFLINSAIFLLIGLESPLNLIIERPREILLAIPVVLLARAVVIYGTAWISRRRANNAISRGWDVVMFWGGLRGSVSLALALSLPGTLAWRNDILALTLGYVLFSLVVGGMTMKPLLKRQGLTRRSLTRERWESLLAQLRMTQATQHTVEQLAQQHMLPPGLEENFRRAVDLTSERYWTEMERLLLDDPDLHQERTRYILNEIVRGRRAALQELEQRGFITEHTYQTATEELIRQAGDSLDAESSEQIFAILSGLIGQWDRTRTLHQIMRDTPELTELLVKSTLLGQACRTIGDLSDSREAVTPFVVEDLSGYLQELHANTDQELQSAILHNDDASLQAQRMVIRELLSGQRSALARLLRRGLIREQELTMISNRLDAIESSANAMQDARELNALMLAIPGMIRSLDLSSTPPVPASPQAAPAPASPPAGEPAPDLAR
ncbi:MAG: Na+/H+ antiporter [Anaerolineae bacterium]|nr:Na+/H+ antiporter [Anaerolineae bacterium]